MKNLYAALIKFQSQLKPIAKTKENPYFHSNYADLTGLWDAVRIQLTENELAVIQSFDCPDGTEQFLITKLIHSSGESIDSRCKVIMSKNDAQAFGSAVTYLRRYSFSAILGLTTEEDDDGNAAVAPISPKTQPKPLIPALAAPVSESRGSPNAPWPKCAICGKTMIKSKFDKGAPFWCPCLKEKATRQEDIPF